MPEAVAEYDHVLGSFSVVSGSERAPENGLNTEDIEEISCNLRDIRVRRDVVVHHRRTAAPLRVTPAILASSRLALATASISAWPNG